MYFSIETQPSSSQSFHSPACSYAALIFTLAPAGIIFERLQEPALKLLPIDLPYVQINFSSPAYVEIMANAAAGPIPKPDIRERFHSSQIAQDSVSCTAGEMNLSRM
jgi:hypothetical protein